MKKAQKKEGRGVVANVLDCDTVESKFKLQSFTFELTPFEWIELPNSFRYGLNSTATVLQQK